MKKVSILMVIVAAMSFVSCAQAPKANLKTDLDSLSYATGVARTDGLIGYLTGQMRVDTAYMADFMRGFLLGVESVSDKDFAYTAGVQIGQTVGKYWVEGLNQQIFGTDSTKTISKENMVAGFVAGVTGKNLKMPLMEAQAYSQQAMESIKAKAMESEFGENKKAGEEFLAANKGKEGVVTTESGLQYKVIKAGNGEIPQKDSRVKVHYKGTLTDGTEFDSSYGRGEPSTFRADQVIAGWTEALTLMPVGSKWELYIPQNLAYGTRNQGQIKPFSALVFEVELLSIEK
ncbi:FKBP-type peptidyl-prolyl cis-trans isomerase [Bacteroides sp. OttesenSCG-928-D19]|nr:FKBP-type peptidyl-prolyl cis-trans isomerase [Bacteroides sp. OttesenSCG-928-N06]MDL2304091.1 FKBP-type peptidyl-prolyl cis-trans isomerase [Bacteroides sp. OttesenSCG-928-D19]